MSDPVFNPFIFFLISLVAMHQTIEKVSLIILTAWLNYFFRQIRSYSTTKNRRPPKVKLIKCNNIYSFIYSFPPCLIKSFFLSLVRSFFYFLSLFPFLSFFLSFARSFFLLLSFASSFFLFLSFARSFFLFLSFPPSFFLLISFARSFFLSIKCDVYFNFLLHLFLEFCIFYFHLLL